MQGKFFLLFFIIIYLFQKVCFVKQCKKETVFVMEASANKVISSSNCPAGIYGETL